VKKAKEDYNPFDPKEDIEIVIPIEDYDQRRMEVTTSRNYFTNSVLMV